MPVSQRRFISPRRRHLSPDAHYYRPSSRGRAAPRSISLRAAVISIQRSYSVALMPPLRYGLALTVHHAGRPHAGFTDFIDVTDDFRQTPNSHSILRFAHIFSMFAVRSSVGSHRRRDAAGYRPRTSCRASRRPVLGFLSKACQLCCLLSWCFGCYSWVSCVFYVACSRYGSRK